MANTYNSAYKGDVIDRAGRLPAPTSGSVGQFLKKNDAAGNMVFADPGGAIFFTNKTVAKSAWVEDTKYAKYPYHADIACAGITANYFPQVIFDLDEALSGYFAPICESISGAIRIWASDIPEEFTIPTLIGIRS